MYKVYSIIGLLAIASLAVSAAQDGAVEGANAAPEPYSYGYETDSHSAAEQRDPSGAVTGFYTLTDADGRQRRVEYVADEAGFRAKVQTNEVGTKSQNSADVEVLAAPPTQEQLVYQPPQPQPQQQQVVQVQRTQQAVAQQLPVRTQQLVSQQYYQPGYAASYGYYPGSAYGGYGAGYLNSAYSSPYGYTTGGYYAPSYGYNTQGLYSSYNNHLPSSYYKALNGQQQQQQVAGGLRYVSTSTTGALNGVNRVVGQPAFQQAQAGYRTAYQTIGGYQGVAPLQTTYTTLPVQGSVQGARSSSLTGSSNYIVLKKKREDSTSTATTEEQSKVVKTTTSVDGDKKKN